MGESSVSMPHVRTGRTSVLLDSKREKGVGNKLRGMMRGGRGARLGSRRAVVFHDGAATHGGRFKPFGGECI